MMMSLTEDVTSQTSESLARHSVLAEDLSQDGLTSLGAPGARVLLVWDAPNLDMGLGSILGRRPTALERPRFDALGRWLLARTAEIVAGRPGISTEPEATVFTNIAPGSAEVVRPWVDALRNVGFAVFAKPKVDEDSDVDRDMLAHIDEATAKGSPRWWWRRPTVRHSANRWRRSPAAEPQFKCSDFVNTPVGR